MKAITYHAPAHLSRRYSLAQICLLAETGEARNMPEITRKSFRKVVINNIEAQEYHGRNMALGLEIRMSHLSVASKLKKTLKAIPS